MSISDCEEDDNDFGALSRDAQMMYRQAGELMYCINNYAKYLYVRDALPPHELTREQINSLAQHDYYLARFDIQPETD